MLKDCADVGPREPPDARSDAGDAELIEAECGSVCQRCPDAGVNGIQAGVRARLNLGSEVIDDKLTGFPAKISPSTNLPSLQRWTAAVCMAGKPSRNCRAMPPDIDPLLLHPCAMAGRPSVKRSPSVSV